PRTPGGVTNRYRAKRGIAPKHDAAAGGATFGGMRSAAGGRSEPPLKQASKDDVEYNDVRSSELGDEGAPRGPGGAKKLQTGAPARVFHVRTWRRLGLSDPMTGRFCSRNATTTS